MQIYSTNIHKLTFFQIQLQISLANKYKFIFYHCLHSFRYCLQFVQFLMYLWNVTYHTWCSLCQSYRYFMYFHPVYKIVFKQPVPERLFPYFQRWILWEDIFLRRFKLERHFHLFNCFVFLSPGSVLKLWPS